VEASALPVPAARGRIFISASLLRLRSDDQLVALFRAGSDEAFRAIHDRYRQRLFAYARQMLAGSRQDAEDALQDVFVRAYSALRADGRPVSLRAWLYRIAHNRCIDQLRRPAPIPTEMVDLNFGSLQDPLEATERSQQLRQLVSDVQRLPDQQRSALLMRELQGMSYADLAVALDVSVAAVKSLLLRARTSLIEAAIARDTSCEEIQADLVHAHDHGARASSRARRHLRECEHCGEYRTRLRSMQKSFAALTPAGSIGGVGILAKLFGGSGAAAGGAGATTSIAGGGTMLGGAATVTAGKVAALVCGVAIVGAGVAQRTIHSGAAPHRTHHARMAATPTPQRAAAAIEPAAPVVAARTGGTPAPPSAGGGAHQRWLAHHRRADAPLTGQDSYPAVVLPGDANGVKPPATTLTPNTTSTGPSPNPILQLLTPKSGSSTSSGSGSQPSTGSSGGSSGASGTSGGSGSSSSPSGSSSSSTTTGSTTTSSSGAGSTSPSPSTTTH
jgi:RNA polymerase sigma factor (sigma-70 family)